MITSLLVFKIGQLFLVMTLGYIMVKLNIIKTKDSIVLSKISLYLIMPCVIMNAFQVNFKSDVQKGLILAFASAIIIHILLITIGYMSKKFLNLEETEIASIVYSNAGNLIIPIVAGILGSEWVIYSSAFISVQLIFLWTHCKSMFSKEKKADIRKIILNINIIAIFVGLVFMIFRIKLPLMINDTMKSVGGMIGPMGMLITGMLGAQMNLKQLILNKRIYLIVFLRMIFCPSIILIVLKFSGVSSLVCNGKEILLITFLATTTPAASTVTQFSQIYSNDAEYAGAINIMTTIVCIVTMPIFVTLYYI